MMLNHLSAAVMSIAASSANHVWQSTVFAAVVALLTLCLRKNQARIRYRLWLAASLKFLLPFSLLTALGGHLARPLHWLGSQGHLPTAMQEAGQPFLFVVTALGHATTATYLLPLLIVATWLCGVFTVLGLWFSRWRRVASLTHGASPKHEGRELNALRRLEEMSGVKKPIPFLLSTNALEPGIFGIVRPVLLWPASLSDHLSNSHTEAILTHELAHVRRRDNLAAAIHMMVEAIFWFHPLVWWLGARLVDERERACDEAVLQLGNPPQTYAESILKTCEFCVSAPLACISGVTGADLKQRIARIMTQRSAAQLNLSRKLLLSFAGILTVAGPMIFGLASDPLVIAQSPQASAPPQMSVEGAQPPRDIASNAQSEITTSAPRVYKIGGEVKPPELVYAPDPEFSEEAKRAKFQGVCVLSLIVDAQGLPQNIRVVRHLGMGLDRKAVEAIQQYRYKPATLHKEPVAVQVHIEVNFRRY